MTTLAVLLSPAGQELLARLRGEDVTAGQALRLAEQLRGSYPPDLVAAALTEQALRMSARAKFGRAQEMLFTRDGLEQASSEQAAAHSARRMRGFAAVADLCCGIGGNLSALAASSRVLAVDRDLTSLEFARHNAAVSGAPGPVLAVCADVRQLVADSPQGAGGRIEAAFIDPARRAGGRRLRAGVSEPPMDWCLRLTDWVPAVGIKAAPGLPLELVPPGWEAEFLAVGRGLKEALLWSPALASAPRRATILPTAATTADTTDDTTGASTAAPVYTLTAEPGSSVPVAAPGEFLLDPNPSVTRAGLVEDLARRLGAWKIDPMIAFLATDREVSTPFARTLRVLESMPWHEKQAARRLRELGIGAADIRRRGLAGDVDLIRRRLGLRGEGAATIVLTRREDRPWGLICTPVSPARTSPAT